MRLCTCVLKKHWYRLSCARLHAQANAVLKEERGNLAIDGQVGLLLQSVESDSAAVRATALQARLTLCHACRSFTLSYS